jgi:hypothetical protein
MSRSNRSGKGPGYELWGGRPMDGHNPSKKNKVMCHRIERARAKQELHRAKSQLP